jgi:putative peptidoglycan lipid II flippase
MVRRVIEMLYREVRGLHQAAYVLAAFAFGSQILALVRDRLLAYQFGADIELDIYYAAFRIPDLLYVLFASTLSVYALCSRTYQRR